MKIKLQTLLKHNWRTLLLLLTLITTGQEILAATATTIFYAINTNYTVKCNVNRKGDGSDWATYTMEKQECRIFNSKSVYKCTFTDLYNGLGALQFQLYDGDTWKSQVQPISSWTTVSTYNNKIYDGSWQTYTDSDGDIGNTAIKIKVGSSDDFYRLYSSWYDDSNTCNWVTSSKNAFDNHDFGTVTSMEINGYVVTGWRTDCTKQSVGSDNNKYWISGRLQYKITKKDGTVVVAEDTKDYGNYSNHNGAYDILCNSGNNRVVGKNSQTIYNITNNVTTAGEYKLVVTHGYGQLNWSNNKSDGGTWGRQDGTGTATFTIPGYSTTSGSNDFGNVDVGQSSYVDVNTSSIHFGSTTTATAAITGDNADQFSTSDVTVTANGFRVTFTPTSAGTKSATVTVTDAYNKAYTFTVTGTGVAQCITAGISSHPASTPDWTWCGSEDPDEEYTLSVTATGTSPTYQWQRKSASGNGNYSDIDGATESTYLPTTDRAGTSYIYRCVVSVSCDNSTANSNDSRAYYWYSIPSLGSIGGAGNVCNGGELSLSYSGGTGGVSYHWEKSTDDGTNYEEVGENDNEYSETLDNSGSSNIALKYRIKVATNHCDNTSEAEDVTVLPTSKITSANIKNSSSVTENKICLGATGYTANYTKQGDGTVTWSSLNSNVVSISNGAITTVGPGGGDLIRCTLTNSTCPSATQSDLQKDLTVYVLPTPETSITGELTQCAGSSVQYGVNSVAKSITVGQTTYSGTYSYLWSVVSGSAFGWTRTSASAATTPAQFTVGTSTGTIGVTPTLTYTTLSNKTCSSAQVTKSVSVDATSNAGSIADATACSGVDTQLQVTGITGSVTKWKKKGASDANWSDIENSASSQITVAPTVNTSYKAVVKNGVCDAVETETPGVITVNYGSIARSDNESTAFDAQYLDAAGTAKNFTYTISCGATNFRASVTAGSDDYSVGDLSVAGSTLTVPVTFRPSTHGTRNGTVTITYDKTNSTTGTATLSLTGTGKTIYITGSAFGGWGGDNFIPMSYDRTAGKYHYRSESPNFGTGDDHAYKILLSAEWGDPSESMYKDANWTFSKTGMDDDCVIGTYSNNSRSNSIIGKLSSGYVAPVDVYVTANTTTITNAKTLEVKAKLNCAEPSAKTVSASSPACNGGTVTITTTSAESGFTYQLYVNGVADPEQIIESTSTSGLEFEVTASVATDADVTYSVWGRKTDNVLCDWVEVGSVDVSVKYPDIAVTGIGAKSENATYPWEYITLTATTNCSTVTWDDAVFVGGSAPAYSESKSAKTYMLKSAITARPDDDYYLIGVSGRYGGCNAEAEYKIYINQAPAEPSCN